MSITVHASGVDKPADLPPAPVTRALISVFDKTGVLEFARGLHALGVEILSTGGTARMLAEAGVPVIEVSDYTGFPEMLDGRVKTLHPKVHGGLLARRDLPAHMAALEQHGIGRIDLLAVNLYPFQQTVARPGVTLDEAIENIDIGSTLCKIGNPDPLPLLRIDEPTLTMEFLVNTSPLAGREGKYVTSRQIRERLERELQANVALRVEFTEDADTFVVSGRGQLHLTILLENMRREGYELAVSRPKPRLQVVDGERQEPYEALTMDLEEEHQGAVMEALGRRRGELQNMEPDGKGRVRLEYRVPARGLIGFQNEFLNMTRGTGIMSHVFEEYGPWAGEIEGRRQGVLISQDDGAAVAYALWKLQDRGRMFVKPNDALYEGMIIGIHTRDNDLVVNPIREKKLTNVRASGKDEAINLTPPIELTLEKAVEFIAEDELVEITPKSIRLRKRHLKEHERRRASREGEA